MIVKKLDSGLHILATPIGTANDITIRALNILRDADILDAEDTRVLRKLIDTQDDGEHEKDGPTIWNSVLSGTLPIHC